MLARPKGKLNFEYFCIQWTPNLRVPILGFSVFKVLFCGPSWSYIYLVYYFPRFNDSQFKDIASYYMWNFDSCTFCILVWCWRIFFLCVCVFHFACGQSCSVENHRLHMMPCSTAVTAHSLYILYIDKKWDTVHSLCGSAAIVLLCVIVMLSAIIVIL